jgi:hypothetical protein
MRSQLTPEAMVALLTALGIFWTVVAVLIRRHGQRTRTPEEPRT